MKLFRLLFPFLMLCVLASCSHQKSVVAGSKDGCYPLPGAKVISPYKNNRGSAAGRRYSPPMVVLSVAWCQGNQSLYQQQGLTSP